MKLPLWLIQSNDDHSSVTAVNNIKSRIITCKCQNVVIHIVTSQILPIEMSRMKIFADEKLTMKNKIWHR